jgi:hypothetical protein
MVSSRDKDSNCNKPKSIAKHEYLGDVVGEKILLYTLVFNGQNLTIHLSIVYRDHNITTKSKRKHIQQQYQHQFLGSDEYHQCLLQPVDRCSLLNSGEVVSQLFGDECLQRSPKFRKKTSQLSMTNQGHGSLHQSLDTILANEALLNGK